MSSVVRVVLSVLLLGLIAFASCGSPAAPTRSSLGPRPSPSPRVPTPQPATDEEAIRLLVASESAALVAKDLAGLMDLWAEDAVVADAKHTPEDTSDDARWRGRDAIRERYVVLVFPGNPQSAGPRDLQITIEGDRAIAVGATGIGAEVSPGGDRWTFVKRDGRWWIESLTYNLEATGN